MIALLDANNFFVSCERVFRPDLVHKPVAVLSNNDGCLIARSNEVKEMGVPMGAPYFKYKKILDQHNVTVFSSNFSLYGDMSARMMSIIRSFAPNVEIYSVDEAFIDCSGIEDLEGFAKHIRQVMWSSLGLPVSIGISHTKVLSKAAAHFSKKVKAFKSVCVLKEAERIDKALHHLKVRDIWGVGKKTAQRLERRGILTAYNLKQVDPRWMRQNFTVIGERLVRELNGISCLKIDDREDHKQSIQVTRSFSKSITEFEELNAVVASYASKLGRKLRADNLKTTSISVFIRTNRHRPQDIQYGNSTIITFPFPRQDDAGLIKAASQALQDIYRPGLRYSKAGVVGLGLVSEDHAQQMDLFAAGVQEGVQSPQLWEAFDELNQRYGVGTVFSAACGKSVRWRDKKDNVSPAYTTSWEDLPIVRAG